MKKCGRKGVARSFYWSAGLLTVSLAPSLAAQPSAPAATPSASAPTAAAPTAAAPSSAAPSPAAAGGVPSASTTPPATPNAAATPPEASTPQASNPPAPPATEPAKASAAGTPAASPPAGATPAGATPAAPLSARARQAARQRFDRGLELYDTGDYAGALREFQGALEVTRHPVVLYNVALVYAQLGAPVQCVQSVEELQQGGLSGLDAASREHLRLVYEEQKARIGRLRIRANVDSAFIQLDGVDIGQHVIDDLPIAAGDHIVATVASGYIPRRMHVVVPANAAQEVNFNLQPLETTLAHLAVTTDVPDVDVSVDGEAVGRTPFPASLAFSPGPHQVVLSRAGYHQEKRNIVLDPGGEGRLQFEMHPDVVAIEQSHGVLELQISEPNSLVSLNGKPLAIGRNRLELPLGRHHLQIHSAGFVDYTRDVVVEAGGTMARIDLMPTSEFLNDYQNHALSQRTWGWISVGGGAALLGGGIGFLVWNQGEKDTATENLDSFARDIEASPNGNCSNSTCVRKLALLGDEKDEARSRDVYGWVGVGVGAAAAALGAGLLIWGDDPERYAPRQESDVFGSLRLDVGVGRAALSGQF